MRAAAPATLARAESEFKRNAVLRGQYNALRLRIGMTGI